MYKHIFKLSSCTQKNTQNPINIFEIKIDITSKWYKIHSNNKNQNRTNHRNISENQEERNNSTNKKNKNLFCYISKFHNSYFVYFVWLGFSDVYRPLPFFLVLLQILLLLLLSPPFFSATSALYCRRTAIPLGPRFLCSLCFRSLYCSLYGSYTCKGHTRVQNIYNIQNIWNIRNVQNMNYGVLIHNEITFWYFWFFVSWDLLKKWTCMFVLLVCFVLKIVKFNAFIEFCVFFCIYEDTSKFF